MPAVHAPATVLVTGASGFSGSWIARAFLEAGYSVRGAVRSESKGQYLVELFKTHGDRFKPVIVEDISKPGAFDEAFDDSVAAVIHVAGLVKFTIQDTPDMFGPNTDGVVNLLQSTLQYGKNVKRFVYMSSAMAMQGHEDIFHVYTEDDWADKSIALVKEKGGAAGGQILYAASKALAERAIVDFVEKHKCEIQWDETRILPAWIFGPTIHDWKSIDDLNLSSKLMHGYLTTPRENDKVNDYASEYIDVRDVADAFVAALQVEAAAGGRFIIDAGAFTYQNLYDAVHAAAPDLEGVVRGNPDAPLFVFPGAFCDSSKAKDVLKLKEFRSLGECAVDTYKSVSMKL